MCLVEKGTFAWRKGATTGQPEEKRLCPTYFGISHSSVHTVRSSIDMLTEVRVKLQISEEQTSIQPGRSIVCAIPSPFTSAVLGNNVLCGPVNSANSPAWGLHLVLAQGWFLYPPIILQLYGLRRRAPCRAEHSLGTSEKHPSRI